MIFYDAKEFPLKELPHERSLKPSWILTQIGVIIIRNLRMRITAPL